MMRCLVIEDEAKTADYIRKGLEEEGHGVVLCADGEEGMRLGVGGQWDVVVLDRMLLGGMDGLAILKAVRDAGKATPVLILSALASLDERVKGLREGGDDYLTKPFAFTELMARIEALTRRSQQREEVRELRIADLRMDLVKRKVERGGKPILLRPREFRLLEFMVRHQGQVITRTMLLESVWDCHFDPGTNIIDVQISRLRNKIDKSFSPPLLHTLRGEGYTIKADA